MTTDDTKTAALMASENLVSSRVSPLALRKSSLHRRHVTSPEQRTHDKLKVHEPSSSSVCIEFMPPLTYFEELMMS